MNRPHRLFVLLASIALPTATFAIDFGGSKNPDRQVTVHGSVQADGLFPEHDATIGTQTYKEKFLFNGYANAGLFSKYIDAGLRAASMLVN